MNQIVPMSQRAPALPSVTFVEMEKLAESIASSGLFGMKTKEQALALMAIAQAEGRHPALAARDYDIIQNRPSKKAEAVLRDFLEAGGKVEWHDLSDTVAHATFSHPSGGTVPIKWDMERAKAAGLGGKDMWRKYPRQMLRSRCVSEGVRTVCPAATSGMYVPEEVADFDAPRSQPAPAKPAPVVVIEAKPIEPPHDPETGEVSPHAIARGGTATEWGSKLIAALNGAQSVEEVQAWMSANAEALNDMEQKAPKTYTIIDRAAHKRNNELAAKPTPAEIAAAELSGEAPPF